MKKHTIKIEVLENGDGLVKLPDEIIDKFQFKDGDQVELITQKDRITLIMPPRSKFKLDNHLEGINEKNLHGEILSDKNTSKKFPTNETEHLLSNPKNAKQIETSLKEYENLNRAMTKILVKVGKSDNNFAACIDGLDGFVCTADTFEELKKEVVAGVDFHLEGLRQDNERVPEVFKGVYKFIYKSDISKEEYLKANQRMEEIIKSNQVTNDTPKEDPLLQELDRVSEIVKVYEDLNDEINF